MKILVTGTAGFIGFHLAERLMKEGDWDIVGLDNINDYYDVNLKLARLRESGINKDKIEYNKFIQSEKNSKYRFIKLNLEDQSSIAKLFSEEKFDYVINFAAQAGVRYSLENPYAYINSNIYGFLNILEGCRHNNVKHLFYASSSSVYGSNEKLPFSEKDRTDNPISLYAATKKSNELMAHTYSYLFNLPTTGLRFFTVYGPWGRPDMALFKFTKAILNNQPIDVYNNGNMKRDFTYIDDIVVGICKTIVSIPISNPDLKNFNLDSSSSLVPYMIYNLGNNNPIELLKIINLLENIIGKKAIIHFQPLQVGDIIKTNSDNEKAMKYINYNPNTAIDMGITKFVSWYLNTFLK